MCGIALSLQGQQRVEKMLELLKHRGPDASNISTAGQVSLGHARLAIVDTTDPNSAQPLWASNQLWTSNTRKYSHHGNYTAAFNGEIFNYVELGYGSEIQVLSDLIIQRRDLSQFVNGYYAAVVHDIGANSIIMTRDLFGVMPLYYTLTPNFEVASERKALNQSSKIYTVSPNTRLEYSLATRKIKTTTYSQPFRMGANVSIVTLWNTFVEAVRRTATHSDNGFSVALSGGLDSSMILAALYSLNIIPTDVITTYSQIEDTREVDNAKLLMKNYGWSHLHTIVPALDISEDELRYYIETPKNPIRDFAFKRHATVAKYAKSKVILCGEGADELGLGYPRENPNFPWKSPINRYISKTSLLKSQATMTLDRVNKAGMMFSKEYRVPFLDLDFVGNALACDANTNKKLFRIMVEDWIPYSIAYGEKYTNEELVGRV